MMATERKASKPSRKTMMRAGIIGWSFAELHGPFADRHDAIGRGGALPLSGGGKADPPKLQVVKSRRGIFCGGDIWLGLCHPRVLELVTRAPGGAEARFGVGGAAGVGRE